MGSAGLAGAAFVIGALIGWFLRPRGGTARGEAAGLTLSPERRALDAERLKLEGDRAKIAEERKAITAERAAASSDRAEGRKQAETAATEAKRAVAESQRLKAEREELAAERGKIDAAWRQFADRENELARSAERLEHDRDEFVRTRALLEADTKAAQVSVQAAPSRERSPRVSESRRSLASHSAPERASDPGAVAGAAAPYRAPQAGQRETTVLVCDVGSASAEAEIPPNVLRCLTDLQKVLGGIIADEGGTIDRFAGNRLIALFAPKRRSPDHAGRALEAAERIASNVGALSRRLQYDLRISVGLHSGALPLDGDGHLDAAATGDAIDIASRLETVAGEAKVGVVLTEAVLTSAEREEGEFDLLPDVPLGGGPMRVFSLRARK